VCCGAACLFVRLRADTLLIYLSDVAEGAGGQTMFKYAHTSAADAARVQGRGVQMLKCVTTRLALLRTLPREQTAALVRLTTLSPRACARSATWQGAAAEGACAAVAEHGRRRPVAARVRCDACGRAAQVGRQARSQPVDSATALRDAVSAGAKKETASQVTAANLGQRAFAFPVFVADFWGVMASSSWLGAPGPPFGSSRDVGTWSGAAETSSL
jgi:hypothetical protein